MTTLSKEEVSRHLSNTLDCLGYSQEMIHRRSCCYSECGSKLNSDDLRTKIVGSRGEGLIKYCESDCDVLLLSNYITVVEDYATTQKFPETESVFYMAPCLLHAGHFKLKLLKQGTVLKYPGSCLKTFESGCWLSSKTFMEVQEIEGRTSSGPASTATHSAVNFSLDRVLTFPCICPTIIQSWIQRSRQNDWPPKILRERISCMSANVVATGQKGCPIEDMEWRLCFNEIELLLVESWNETHKKLYKVLKMIKKDVLEKEGFNVSSFILKNVVMWLSEKSPESAFKPECLMPWIIKSLRLLRRAVKVYYLPYYMIPERNLIAERVQRFECKRLMRLISSLIHSGPQLLRRCMKLEFARSMTPSELLVYKQGCEMLEMLLLVGVFKSCMNKGNLTIDDPSFTFLLSAIVTFVEWPPAVKEMLKDKTSPYEQIQTVLE